MQNQSEVENYWNQIAKAFGDTRTWVCLSPNEQMVIINSINLLLAVLYRQVQ